MPAEEILRKEGPYVTPIIPPEVAASGITEVPNHEAHLKNITTLLNNEGSPLAEHTGETREPETDHMKSTGIVQPRTTPQEPQTKTETNWWKFMLRKKHREQGKEEKNAA